MSEKTSIEILIDFAEERNIPYFTKKKSKDFVFITNERYSSSKFIVYKLDKFYPGLYFIFSDSFSAKIGSKSTYCGIFKEFPEYIGNVKIIKRDWFDSFSFSKRYTTGDKYIDKNITIQAEYNNLNNSLTNTKNIEDFIELANKVTPISLEIMKDSISVIPELHGKNLISITTNRWILDYDELDILINKGSDLIKKISPSK